jgi:hypothetical protein
MYGNCMGCPGELDPIFIPAEGMFPKHSSFLRRENALNADGAAALAQSLARLTTLRMLHLE